jgi:F0F1-type ATP synthase membrane subunit a
MVFSYSFHVTLLKFATVVKTGVVFYLELKTKRFNDQLNLYQAVLNKPNCRIEFTLETMTLSLRLFTDRNG